MSTACDAEREARMELEREAELRAQWELDDDPAALAGPRDPDYDARFELEREAEICAQLEAEEASLS
jgi:hypothetical protein